MTQEKIFTEPKGKIRILFQHPEKLDRLIEILSNYYIVWKAEKHPNGILNNEVLIILEKKEPNGRIQDTNSTGEGAAL